MTTVEKKTNSKAAVGRNVVPHFTVDERVARGRAAREECSRSSQGGFELAPDRDPVAILVAQGDSRVPELVPLRYGRMLVSPFTFYRGAAAVMAHDLASTPRAGLRAQLCGDAHLSNVGAFASPERTLVLDLNDFDETLPGPFEWDVKRLVASFEIAGRDREFSDAERQAGVLSAVRSYRESMRQLAGASNLDVWYARLDVDEVERNLRAQQGKQQAGAVAKAAAKARTKDSLKAFAKLTELVDGEPRIVADPPLIVPAADLAEEAGIPLERLDGVIRGLFREYRGTLQQDRRQLLEEFRMVDLARKVVGVGSVGRGAGSCCCSAATATDPLFLQIKEAQGVGARAVPRQERVLEPRPARRRRPEADATATSDIFLGWVHTSEGPSTTSRATSSSASSGTGRRPSISTRSCRKASRSTARSAAPLARAHARSGDRIAIASYLGKGDAFDRALAEFAVAYADQNERDYAALRQAADDGRIAVQEGL